MSRPSERPLRQRLPLNPRRRMELKRKCIRCLHPYGEHNLGMGPRCLVVGCTCEGFLAEHRHSVDLGEKP